MPCLIHDDAFISVYEYWAFPAMREPVLLPAAEISDLKPDNSIAAGNWQLIVIDSARD
jgi:hypothetical protein